MKLFDARTTAEIIQDDLRAHSIWANLERTRRELEESMRPTRELFAAIERESIAWRREWTMSQLVAQTVSAEMDAYRKAEEFRRSMIQARFEATSMVGGVVRLVTGSDIYQTITNLPPIPDPDDRVEELVERVAGLEAALKAALTPPEPPKEEDDDRPLPGQYL